MVGREKKTREEIKALILEKLDASPMKPLPVQELAKQIESNWITIDEALKELQSDGRVKEIVATDKIKLYQKVNSDTYYNLPITNEQRALYTYLFSCALEVYKEQKKRLPNKTELAKVVVDTIQDARLELPVVWYLYGQIPLMIADPSREYPASRPGDAEKIRKIMVENVNKQDGKGTHELRIKHYKKYANTLYEIKEVLLHELGKGSDEQKILESFNRFYVACPTEHPEIFACAERLYTLVGKLALERSLIQQKVKIIVALETVWSFIAIQNLVESLSKYLQYPREELLQFYLDPAIETRKYAAQEVLADLESVYFSILGLSESDVPEETLPARRILADWTGE